jgi:hypothetical protein
VLAILLVVGAGRAGWAREGRVKVGEEELAVAGE